MIIGNTWIDEPPPREPRVRNIRIPRVRGKREPEHQKFNYVVIVVSILIVVGAVVALLRLRSGGVTMSTVPWWVWSHAVVAFLGYRRGIRAGRWVQAWAHTWKGVFSGHKKLIQGKH